jgi:hypothetical protein
MKQKEERDIEHTAKQDSNPVRISAILEDVFVEVEEPLHFFWEAGQTLFHGKIPNLLCYRRKRVNVNLAKHWFIYEYPDKPEVRLLTSDQCIDGEYYSFMNGEDQIVFSYA